MSGPVSREDARPVVLLAERPGEGGRLGLRPGDVLRLARGGVPVIVEAGAAPDPAWEAALAAAGARPVADREEALAAGGVLLAAGWPPDLDRVPDGATVLTPRGLDRAPVETRRAAAAARDRDVVFLAGERLADEEGRRPVAEALARVAGTVAAQVACSFLALHGPGVLAARLPGLEPPRALVLGAGEAGMAAARRLAAVGLPTTLLEPDPLRLRRAHERLPAEVLALPPALDGGPDDPLLRRLLREARIVVVAVGAPGAAPPRVLDREALAEAVPGTVLVDLTAAGEPAVATSRPIAHPREAYVEAGVHHLPLADAAALAPVTASEALAGAWFPFVARLAEGAHPTAHRTFGPAAWWGAAPG